MNDDINNPNSCLNPETGQYYHTADEVLPEITESECETLQNNVGLTGTSSSNCDDLNQMLCDLKQEVNAINVQDSILVAANTESKCSDDGLPTQASMWSRILRCSKAIVCTLCGYDPRVSTILRSGQYPQILMGPQQEGGYPQWVNSDTTPQEGSIKPVTSGGIYRAIQETLLSTWHLWEEYPEFGYFAQTYSGSGSSSHSLEEQTTEYPPVEGDTALVATNGTDNNIVYTFTDGEWVQTKVIVPGADTEDKLVNFATTHINKGYYADNGMYFFDDGDHGTWQAMDVQLGEIENQIAELQKTYEQAVVSGQTGVNYALTTVASVSAANAVPCASDTTTIVLITG